MAFMLLQFRAFAPVLTMPPFGAPYTMHLYVHLGSATSYNRLARKLRRPTINARAKNSKRRAHVASRCGRIISVNA